MYLSGTLEKFDGTIGAAGTYITNGGSYWDSFTVDGQYEAWYRTVYKDDHPITDNIGPSHVVINSVMDEPSTVIVEQQGASPSGASVPVSTGSISAKADEPVYVEIPIVSEYARVKTINGDGANAGSITQTVRLKDRYY